MSAEARATPREGLDQPVIELPEQGTRADFARVTKYWRDRAIAAEAALRAPAEAPQAAQDYKALYHDLLYQVAHKHPGETRHETAKRYIQQAEAPSTDAARAALAATVQEDRDGTV